MSFIDLHIHTNCSDGTLTPKEIIKEAAKNKVNVISITDHDTIEAYTDELFNYAHEKEIELITGVEISTKLNNVGYHVLGYHFDIYNQELRNKLAMLKNSRHDYLYHVCLKLKELGYIVNFDELNNIEIITKAHIANNVINNKENEKLLFTTFQHCPNTGEFIETIMNEGCPAYVKKETITPIEASHLIKNAGGKVVLAHPVCYKYENNVNEKQIQQILHDMNADGIEAIYIYIDCKQNKINEINKWKKFAEENQLFITIGSDFHFFDQIHPKIGLTSDSTVFNAKENEKIIYNIKK